MEFADLLDIAGYASLAYDCDGDSDSDTDSTRNSSGSLRTLSSGSWQTASVHDTPVIGHFTQFFADSFSGTFGFGKMTPEEIEEAFDKIDKDKTGILNKTELSDALRELGRSEREIQRFVEDLQEELLDFEEFKALCEGNVEARPYTTSVNAGGYDLPLPNLAKVHDVPILGGVTLATSNFVRGVWSGMTSATFSAAYGGMSDEELKKKFDEIDIDHSGTLDDKKIAYAMRELGSTEADIKKVRDRMGENELDFEAFKALVKPKVGETSVHDNPVTGHFTLFFADSFNGTFGFGEMTEEEMKVAFDKIDKDKSGTLDKTELADALRELGKSEREIQRLIDNMEEDELSFEEFQALVEGKARPYTTEVAGVTVPNLAKVHDVPVLGAFTHATAHLFGHEWRALYSVMGSAFGAAFGGLSDEELREKFDEIDTDKSGKLDKKEVSAALRKLKTSEADIQQITATMGDAVIDFEEFKKLVKK